MSDLSSRLREVASSAARFHQLKGSGHHHVFKGDPVDVSETAAAGLANEEMAEQAIPAAVVANRDLSTAQRRASAFEAMTPKEQNEVKVVPALVVANAAMTVTPVTRPMPASVVDYNFLRTLTDYANQGYVQQADATDGTATVVFKDAEVTDLSLDDVGFWKTIPAFKFTITSSPLNSRPGAQFTLVVSMTSISGKVYTAAPGGNASGRGYTFARINYTQPVVGVYIPFDIKATRTVPVLAVWGSPTATIDSIPSDENPYEDDAEFRVTITKGMTTEEVLIVESVGYSTACTSLICKLYGFDSGSMIR